MNVNKVWYECVCHAQYYMYFFVTNIMFAVLRIMTCRYYFYYLSELEFSCTAINSVRAKFLAD